MRLIFFTLLILFTNNICFGLEGYWGDEPISATIISFQTNYNETVAIAKHNRDKILIKLPKTNLKVGKAYNFYPAYDVQKLKNKNGIDASIRSIGIIQNGKSPSDFRFKNVEIGHNLRMANEKLKALGLKVTPIEEEGNFSEFSIPEFDLGIYTVKIVFSGDINGKLSHFNFIMSKPVSELDDQYLKNAMIFFLKLFTEKYGKPEHVFELNNFQFLDKEFHYASWRFGEFTPQIFYNYEKGICKVIASVQSINRILRTHNYIVDINNNYKEEIEKIKSKSVKEAASSY